MGNYRSCLDPEEVVPIARIGTEKLQTGHWKMDRPRYREKVSPCRAVCPCGHDIPLALHRMLSLTPDEALSVFLEENPLPGVTGRVCYHPCQQACNRGELDEAVHIRDLERWAADHGQARPASLTEAGQGQKVAIVGSGPAGLSAAYHLRRMGHPVTIFEKENRVGGMLTSAIPAYRLPDSAVQHDLERILDIGVRIRTATAVSPLDLDDIREEYAAVFLATGAGLSKRLRTADHFETPSLSALDLLGQVRCGQAPELFGHVAVFGGGNVAVDASMTALRLKVRQVTMVCLESRSDMPAHPDELEEALEEGVRLLDGWGLERLSEKNQEQGLELRLIRCTRVLDESGAFCPRFDRSDVRTLSPDWVISAVGQERDLTLLGSEDPAESLKPETLATSRSNIFTGGDLARGPGSVTQALADGKRAAAGIHETLCPGSRTPTLEQALLARGPSFSIQNLFVPRPEYDKQEVVKAEDLFFLYHDAQPAEQPPRLNPESRVSSFAEIVAGLKESSALREAGRCFFCGLCTDCGWCGLFCPDVSLHRVQETGEKPYFDLDHEHCKGCGICAAICRRGVIHMEHGS
ncbi:MAG: FAD-dependent oxidoreductase [Thermodesulfobacteriota bacterium]